MRVLAALVCLTICFAAPAVHAADWLRSDVAYAATRSLYFEDGGVLSGPLWYDSGKERFEMIVQDQPQVLIRREDEDRFYMMMPQLGLAMVARLGSRKALQDARDYAGLQPEALGRETIAGEMATKYRVVAETGTILIWASDDGIPLRMETRSAEGSFAMELSDLQRGPQPAHLFEVSDGVLLMPVQEQ